MTPAPLDRKLARDLWRMKWQALAIALLITCGVSVAVMSFSAQQALETAQAKFYEQTRFADVFAQLKRAPASAAADLKLLDGVTAVDVGVTELGLAAVPGLQRPALVTLISLPDKPGAGLNDAVLVAGRMPDASRRDEVLAVRSFLDAAKVRLGQRLTVVVNGRQTVVTVVGAALSPEYVYVPPPQSTMPDDAHQAVLWAPRATVEAAAGLSGGFNRVALRLARGAALPQVLADLDRMLAPYGGRAAIGREDQASHAFLTAELKELSTSAAILPPIFLLVAAALVHMTLSRLIDAEREQVGLLKAFGYADGQAAMTYLKLAAAIALTGVIAGGILGGTLGGAMVDLYRRYFRFPVLNVAFDWPAFLAAGAVALVASLAGAISAVRRVAALSPAVAMQPPRPTAYRSLWLDRWLSRVDQATRMIVRRLERFPTRAVLSCVGLAASLSLLVGTQFLFDSLEQVVDHAYFRTSRWTDSIGFAEARAIGALPLVARMPGVIAAEPVRTVAARVKFGARREATLVVGLDEDAQLTRPLDAADRSVPFRGSDVVVSEALADRLGLKLGGQVFLQVLEGRGPQAQATIGALARDYSGFAVYMKRRDLNRLMGEGDVMNGAQLLVAEDDRPAFYKVVEATPQIVGVSSRDETVASWRQAMTEAFRVTISFYIAFAGAIAFGVAYNTARISLSERSRDLATMHVLGFGHGALAYVLGGELMLIALAAAPLGLVGGDALAHGLVAAYSRDEVRLPAMLTARSLGVALLAYLVAVAFGGALVLARIWRLNLVLVLKTRD